jgi:hypothetical protein
MTNLSPAAQAVRIACDQAFDQCGTTAQGLAAALRAAADQVLPLTPKPNDTFCCPPVATILWKRVTDIRSQLLAIAAELEAKP